jgi:signal transduction histidine kinase
MSGHELSKEAITDLVSRFSHDVASPLTSVIALSQVLAREPQTSDRTKEDLERIREAAEEIAAMVLALSERVAPGRAGRRGGS